MEYFSILKQNLIWLILHDNAFITMKCADKHLDKSLPNIWATL